LEEIVLGQDIVYVGGGSMRNLLAIWQAHGLDRLLVQAWRAGTVLAGLSAGAMCWCAGGVSRSSGPPEAIAGLGLLEGSLTVHADGEPERLPVWLSSVRDGTLPGGWALDDGVGLLFRGQRLERAVSSRPGAGAQRVDLLAGELVRGRLEPELLLGDGPSKALGGLDEAVEELRHVNRLRREIVGEGR
jgi:peptidase E